MVTITVTAPCGHMGGLIVKMADRRDNIRIAGGIGPAGRNYIGQDIGCLLYTSRCV